MKKVKWLLKRFEKRFLHRQDAFLNVLRLNLQEFGAILETVDNRDAYDAVMQKATSTLHGMQTALADKLCLQEAMDELTPYGCSMWETRCGTDDVQIQNQKWLFKHTMTHEDCEKLMKSLDINLLAQDGDIVWQMPRDWTFNMMEADDQRKEQVMAKNEKLYVGFFDIGLLKEGILHRLHMRVDPNEGKARERRAASNEFASLLQDVISRCMAHVRLLDYERANVDLQASAPAEAYCLHVWAGPYSKRQEFLSKQQNSGQQKRAQTSDNSSSNRSNWSGPYKRGAWS